MLFTFELILDRDVETVWRAMTRQGNLQKWQPTLKSYEHKSGTPGEVGSTALLTYEEGGRPLVMTETIKVRDCPRESTGVYDTGNATSMTLRNRMAPVDDSKTRWTVEADFRCRGIFWLLSFLLGGMVKRRVRADLDRFKAALESNELN